MKETREAQSQIRGRRIEKARSSGTLMGQLNQPDPPSRKLSGSSSSHDMRKQSSNLTTGVVWNYQG
jgi:hypothetical protein